MQLYRIVDALLDTEIILSYYWKEIDLIPRRVLPPNALVIALSPLLDPRSVGALLDLRARGFDLVVIDVSPIPYAPRPEPRLDALAFDIWTLRRDALRQRLQHAGVAVTEWTIRLVAAGTPGGGAGISASRPSPARLITAGARLAAFAAAAADAATAGGRARRRRDHARRSGARVRRGGARLPLARVHPVGGAGRGRRLSGRARGHTVVDGRAAGIGVLLLLGAELATWSIETTAGSGSSVPSSSGGRRRWRASPRRALVVDLALLGTARCRAAGAC